MVLRITPASVFKHLIQNFELAFTMIIKPQTFNSENSNLSFEVFCLAFANISRLNSVNSASRPLLIVSKPGLIYTGFLGLRRDIVTLIRQQNSDTMF